MKTFSLQSGSNGNSIYVEANGVKLLFDAGISGVQAQRRMARHGRDIHEVDALIISHDHVDHVRCAGVFQRKFGVPIYITRKTRRATRCAMGELNDVRYFASGDVLQFGRVSVHTLRTAHDAADGVAFVVACDGKRLGIMTDLGHPFAGLREALESVDAAYLEANYDPDLLAGGPYPPYLKQRIRGDGGHLSNEESSTLLRACGRHRPKWVAVAHLSQENNTPELAMDAQRRTVGHTYPVHLAPRYDCSELFDV